MQYSFRDLKYLLHLVWLLQLNLFFLVLDPVEKLEEGGVSELDLHLLLWSSVAVTEDAHDRPELPLELAFVDIGSVLLSVSRVFLAKKGVVVNQVLSLVELSLDKLVDLERTVLIVLLRALHQTESIDIANVGLALGP